jgi:hypothetical protein
VADACRQAQGPTKQHAPCNDQPAAPAGSIRTDEPDYSGGARQQLHAMFESSKTSLPFPKDSPAEWPAEEGEILIHDGSSKWHDVGAGSLPESMACACCCTREPAACWPCGAWVLSTASCCRSSASRSRLSGLARSVLQEWMRQAKFCLAPYGHGWGIRLMKVIVAGCVPVIVQVGVAAGLPRTCSWKACRAALQLAAHAAHRNNLAGSQPRTSQDHGFQPYEDILPYEQFSIRLPNSDLPRIRELLAAVTPGEWQRLHEGLKKWWRPFVWEQEAGGTAYQYAIASLKKRLNSLTAGFPLPA